MRDLFRFLYRSRNTLLFLALLGVSLSLLMNGNAHHRAQAITSANNVAGTLYSLRSEVTDYANLKAVNRDLAAENASSRERHASAYSPVAARFVRINDSIHEQQYTVLSAKVVNSTTHKQKNFLLLDKGGREGIMVDMGVIGQKGVVGVVSDLSERFAAVKSVLSPDLKISVKVRRTGHFGLLVWDTNDPRLASVTDIAKHARISEGDTIVTRGGDGIFPAEIPVGIVASVEQPAGKTYQDIKVVLSEDLTRDGYVYVVYDLMRPERDSLQIRLDTE